MWVSGADDPEFTAKPVEGSKPGDGELFIISDGRSDRSLALRHTLIQLVGTLFQGLAILSAAIGLMGVVEILRGRGDSPFGGAWRGRVLPPANNEFANLFTDVAVPVLIGVLMGWFWFGLGRSLKRRAVWARWLSAALLTAVSIPPMARCIQAIWGQTGSMAAFMFLLALMPAVAAWILTSSATDRLFDPEFSLVAVQRAESLGSTHFAVRIIAILSVVALLLMVIFLG